MAMRLGLGKLSPKMRIVQDDITMDFLDDLTMIMRERGMTPRDLSDKTGRAVGTLQGIIYGSAFPNLETLMRIAEALDYDLIESANYTNWQKVKDQQ